MTASRVARLGFVSLWLLLSGCSFNKQPSGQVLIREDGQRHYDEPVDVGPTAIELAPYAALATAVYDGTFGGSPRLGVPCDQLSRSERKRKSVRGSVQKCLVDWETALKKPLLTEWRRWEEFPSQHLKDCAGEMGLYLEVHQRKEAPYTIAVVFKGTRFSSLDDWLSNLRWLGFILPGSHRQDQYTLLGQNVAEEFLKNLEKEVPVEVAAEVPIVTVGHSLGGGLAQYFAYSLPNKGKVPRVSHVYAFDSSPVTGRSQVDPDLATLNSRHLTIHRPFEHGEMLAYVRLLTESFHRPRKSDPKFRKVRFNFVQSANPIQSHSMLRFACELGLAAGTVTEPFPGQDLPFVCDGEEPANDEVPD